jgi:hypothetical protein
LALGASASVLALGASASALVLGTSASASALEDSAIALGSAPVSELEAYASEEGVVVVA